MSETKKKCLNCGQETDNDGYCPKCVAFSLKTDDEKDKAQKKSKKTKEPQIPAVLINKETNERFKMSQLVNKIGRDKDNDLSMPDDSYISRYHAWILFIKEHYWVEDLGSTNGTMLNGELLNERKQISSGDILKFGRTEFVFELI